MEHGSPNHSSDERHEAAKLAIAEGHDPLSLGNDAHYNYMTFMLNTLDWGEYLGRKDEELVNLLWFGNLTGFEKIPTSNDFTWYSDQLVPVVKAELKVLDQLSTLLRDYDPVNFGVGYMELFKLEL
jgi:hypothetical protein